MSRIDSQRIRCSCCVHGAAVRLPVSDLGVHDLVILECQACGHTERITGAMLATAGMKPDERVNDLQRRARCRGCDTKGRAHVTIKWAP